jgi:putative cell wall-binding protein
MEQHRVHRRISAVAVAALVCGTSVLVGASPAGAVVDVTTDRVAGNDRFGTAAEIATTAFPDGSDVVVLASGRSFPDALAGAALALPLLLTEPASLPEVTEAAIDELGADTVLVLGGTAAVSDDVEDDLVAAGHDVTRLAGVDRYETAAEIALEIGAADVADLATKATALIATGLQFADALAGGPVAAAGDGTGATHPILLTSTTVPSPTEEALETLGIEQVVILGGTAAVPASVEARLEQITGNPAIRLAGPNRFATAADVAEAALDDWGFDGTDVLLARGDNGPGNQGFADALAGGPFGGVLGAPVILTNPNDLPAESETFFEDHADTIERITALGGTAAVSQSVLEAAEDAAEVPATTRLNETYTVTPKESATQANGSSRTYTASVGTTVVDIALVPCANVINGSDGKTRFANSNNNTIADNAARDANAPDEASTPAYISSVNGTARQEQDPTINNDYVDDATPSNGAVTFIVSGPSGSSTATTCVIPVVFEDADNADTLSVPATNPAEPSEPFGTGGAVTFAPGAASGGQFNVNTSTSDDAGNRFVGCGITTNSPTEVVNDSCGTFTYDDNDVFQIGGAPSTLALFEATLSAGDDVTGTFRPAPADKSTFNLYSDESPTPPSNAPNSPTETSSSVTVSFFESTQSTVDSYRLYRADMPASGTCPAAPVKGGPQTFAGTPYIFRGSVDDANPTSTPSQSSQLSITDTQVAPGTEYCYRLVSVDDGDEGPATDAIEAETAEGTDTTAPLLTGAVGDSDDAVLDDGDVHTLTFNEAMGDPTTFGSYTVNGANGGSQSIQCQVQASCSLSADAKTLTVTMRPLVSTTLEYPLAITAISGMEDAEGNPVNFTNSTDKTIENTTSAPVSTTPVIEIARAKSTNNNEVDTTDVHELIFSEPMSEQTARTGSYTVRGGLIIATHTITCGDNAVCGLSADFKTLRVHLTASSTLDYPVEITAVSNMTDRDATPKSVDLDGSDTEIEVDNAAIADSTRPAITAVAFGDADDSCSGFGQTGDVLKLTFGTETIAMHFADATAPVYVTEDELKAILGPDGKGTAADDIDYLETTKVLATAAGSVLTLTVESTLAHGVENADNVHGSGNPYITDAAGNPQTTGTQVLPPADATCLAP